MVFPAGPVAEEVRNLEDLVRLRLGVKVTTRTNFLVASVSTTITEILPNAPNRVAWILINLGTASLYVGYDREIASTRAILVGSSGGNLSSVWYDDFQVTGWSLYGLAATGTVNIYAVEFLIYD